MCASRHEEHLGHNLWSLFYMMRFKIKYGRDPTHADTVAHLPPDLAGLWRQAVENAGHEWTEPEGDDPKAEPYAVSGDHLE